MLFGGVLDVWNKVDENAQSQEFYQNIEYWDKLGHISLDDDVGDVKFIRKIGY